VCAATVRVEGMAQRVSIAPSPDRFSPNSGNTAPLLGNTDSGHCARQGCTRPYPGYRYAHQLLDREDYGEELEMKISISLIEQAPVGRAHLSGPTQCKHSPWTIKGRVHSLEKQDSD
jgi:hypothetical protein